MNAYGRVSILQRLLDCLMIFKLVRIGICTNIVTINFIKLIFITKCKTTRWVHKVVSKRTMNTVDNRESGGVAHVTLWVDLQPQSSQWSIRNVFSSQQSSHYISLMYRVRSVNGQTKF